MLTSSSRHPLARSWCTFTVLCALWLVTGCDWTVEEGGARGPLLLRVEQQPDAVAPLDTVQFTAVLARPASPDPRFSWQFENEGRPFVTTDSVSMWIAPDTIRSYAHRVTVATGRDTVRTDSLSFQVDVTDPQPSP